MFVADKIRGLEFVATALGGKITNRMKIESSKQSTEGRHKVVVIFLFVFGRRPSTLVM